jgi:hypothetical protein
MPTVPRIEGLRVVIYPNDHRPAHVHVIGRGCEALFFLRCPDGPPELRENFRFAGSELSAIVDVLAAEVRRLCRRWEEIHGQP